MITVNEHLLNIVKFPNKETSVYLSQEEVFEDNILNIVWKYESDEEIFQIKLLENYIEQNFDVSTVVYCHLPYLPYSRMDRVQEKNHFSLKVFMDLLPKNWNYCFYEPHSSVTQELFATSGIRGSGAITFLTPSLLPQAYWDNMLANNVVVFPDKGAYERYVEGNVELPIPNTSHIMYGSKVRDFSTGDIQSLELHVVDKDGLESDINWKEKELDVVIVDDLCSYGGTFIKVAQALKDSCIVRNIKLVTAHAEDSVLKGNLFSHIDTMYTTNSMNNLPQKSNNNKLVITDFSLLLMTIPFLQYKTDEYITIGGN